MIRLAARRRSPLHWAAVALMMLGTEACHAVVPVVSVAGGGASLFTAIDTVIADADAIIRTACTEYERGKAAADAVIATGLMTDEKVAKIKAVELYGDAACATPPDGDPLATAIWLGRLAGQVATLASEARAGGKGEAG